VVALNNNPFNLLVSVNMLLDIPLDVLRIILTRYLGLLSYPLIFTNKRLKTLVETIWVYSSRKTRLNDFLSVLAGTNYVTLTAWTWKNLTHPIPNCSFACNAGALVMLDWLFVRGGFCDFHYVAETFVKAGDLEGLKWVIKNIPAEGIKPISHRGCVNLASNYPHLNILQFYCQDPTFLYGTRQDAVIWIVDRNDQSGGNVLLKWLHTSGILTDTIGVVKSYAVGRDKVSVLATLKSFGYSFEKDHTLCYHAVEHGSIGSLIWLHEQGGAPWDDHVALKALNTGRLEMLRYIHKNGCDWKRFYHVLYEKAKQSPYYRTFAIAIGLKPP
jgi:hypothetical protein